MVLMAKLLNMVRTRFLMTLGEIVRTFSIFRAPRVATDATVEALKIFKVENAPRLVRTLVLLSSLELVTASVIGQ